MSIDQELEKVVSDPIEGKLIFECHIDGIVRERRQPKDGKCDLRIVFFDKGLDFGIGGQFLMKVAQRKGQNP